VAINTTASGAGLAASVQGFPVLLRLDSTNFPFSQARIDGSDLSAMTTGGRRLPLEVSHWDPVARTGTAWLRMDTIAPNTLAKVRLLWGAKSTPLSGVFDTAGGWSGVWHFSGLWVDAQGRIRTPDATSWRQDGILTGVGTGAGVIAGGLHFALTTDRVRIGSPAVTLGRSDFTWEAWVKVDQGDDILMGKDNGDSIWNHGEKRIQLGDCRYGLHGHGPDLTPSLLDHLNDTTNIYLCADTGVQTGQWNHLVLRQTATGSDSVSVRWFVNGVADTAASPSFLSEPDNASDSLSVGGLKQSGDLWIEEMRISRIARSDAWISLSWQSQQPSGTLVQILPP
jgi:hypothetical protein